MSDILDDSASQPNFIEKILLKIPGFKGYLEREYRRETDHLFRQYLVQRLGEGKKRLSEAVRAAVDTGRLSMLNAVDPASNLLEKVENRIRFASQGYSGFFDAVKIGQKELDTLYAFDQALLTGIDDLVEHLAGLEALAGDEPAFQQGVRGVVERLRAMDSHLNDRYKTIRGLGGE